jgi:anti-sigma regulatory factor (Ser/Thr protein kinase)
MAFSTSQASHQRPPLDGSRRRLRLAIAGGARAPERARAWLQTAARSLSEELERTLLLLTCELVNNSVRHGNAGEDELIEIELWASDGAVAVQVSDSGPGFAPAARDRPLEEPGGWGLVLIDRMAVRWGVAHDGRTRVWFELAAD